MANTLTKLGNPPCNELFTPEDVMSWLPGVDLDPAYSPHSVTRPRYFYDINSDGLDPAHPWNAEDIRVIFNNPPYQTMMRWGYRWVVAALHETRPQVWVFIQAMPGEPYWEHYVWKYAFAVGNLPGRPKHLRPPGADGKREKSVGGSFNSALILFDEDTDRAAQSVADVMRRSAGHRHAPLFVQPMCRPPRPEHPLTPDEWEEIKRGRRRVTCS